MRIFLVLLLLMSCDVGSNKKTKATAEESMERGESTPPRQDDETNQEDEEEADSENEEQEINLDLDSDYDGILDRLDSQPSIANIPQIHLYEIEKPTFSLVFDLGERATKKETMTFKAATTSRQKLNGLSLINNSIVRSKTLNILNKLKKREFIDLNQFPTYGDFYKTEIGCLSDLQSYVWRDHLTTKFEERGMLRNELDFAYKVKFDEISFVSQISKIDFRYTLSNKYSEEGFELGASQIGKKYFNLVGVDSYDYRKKFKLEIESNESFYIDELNPHYSCIHAYPESFSYIVGEKELNFSEVSSVVKQENAHFVIIDPYQSHYISFLPSNYKTLDELANSIGQKISITDQGEIDSLLGLESGNKTKWYFLSTDGKDLFDEVSAGEIYIAIYSSNDQIIKANSYIYNHQGRKPVTSINLGEVVKGEKYYLTTTFESRLLQEGDSSGLITGERSECLGTGRGDFEMLKNNKCDRRRWSKRKKACKFKEKNKNEDLSKWAKSSPSNLKNHDYQIRIGSKKIPPITLTKNKLGYIWVEDKDEPNQTVKILPLSMTQYSYKRIRTEKANGNARRFRCRRGDRKFEVTKKASREFRIKYNLTKVTAKEN